MSRRIGFALLAALAIAPVARVSAEPAGGTFPPYLTHVDRLPVDVRADIESIWTRHTLSRTLVGPPARGPLEFYRLLIDSPDVTAAAGHHLGLPRFVVTRLAADTFAVEDGDGTRGTYRVVARDEHERVVVAHIERNTRLFGRVGAASLARLTFTPATAGDGDPEVRQEVETTVRIEHRMLAFIARVLAPLFPGYADRKIGELFAITARVSEWGHDTPVAFCGWLATQPDGARQRDAFARALPGCVSAHGEATTSTVRESRSAPPRPRATRAARRRR